MGTNTQQATLTGLEGLLQKARENQIRHCQRLEYWVGFELAVLDYLGAEDPESCGGVMQRLAWIQDPEAGVRQRGWGYQDGSNKAKKALFET